MQTMSMHRRPHFFNKAITLIGVLSSREDMQCLRWGSAFGNISRGRMDDRMNIERFQPDARWR
jgi:hypothetical protein